MLRKTWTWITVVAVSLLIAGCAVAEEMTWTGLQALITNGESPVSVALTSDVSAEGEYNAVPIQIPAGKTVTIDLNGHKIDRARETTASCDGYAIYIQPDATLILKDTAGGGQVTGSYDANIGGVYNAGVFRFLSGSITGNYMAGVDNQGEFILDGGSICGNHGQAIRNRALTDSYYGSTVILSGTISDNDWGIRNDKDATLRMDGGTITRDGVDHVVYNFGYFEMNGGAITGNVGRGDTASLILCQNSGSFEMNGGSITGNSGYRGALITVWSDGSFAMTGGEISGNHTAQGTVSVSGPAVLTGGTITDNDGIGFS